MGRDNVSLKALDEAQYLLERMLELVERSAGNDCNDSQRRDMQKGFKLLCRLVDQAMERYQRGRITE